MDVDKIDYGRFSCQYCKCAGSDKIAYILYPMNISPAWIKAATEKYGASTAVITGMDWDNDLSPWGAPGVPDGSADFEGLAPEFLKVLTEALVPATEKKAGLPRTLNRSLIGVSLSGLFTLWQWSQSEIFDNIATLSGSFWYDKFAGWVTKQSYRGKNGRCFMLLGEAEPLSKNRVFASVGTCTDEIVNYLRGQGVDLKYLMVRGNHYQYAQERLEMAMSNLYEQ